MTFLRNATVEWLLSRARGQGGMVALPEEPGSAYDRPFGNFPPGVQAVLNHLGDRYLEWNPEDKRIEWCFLIGGPGNGKSEALRELAELLEVELPSRGRREAAPRTVPSAWPDRGAPVVDDLEIVFINDASIPREDWRPKGAGSLCLDIADGLDKLEAGEAPTILFANINRGILIEEREKARRLGEDLSEAQAVARAVIEWLTDPPRPDEATSGGASDFAPTSVYPVRRESPYYGQLSIDLPVWTVLLHVVFLDALSLLEPSPNSEGVAVEFESSELPRVAPYDPIGGMSKEGGSRGKETVAGQFLADIVKEGRWEERPGGCIDPESGERCEAFDLCPFVQNARWARDENLRDSLIDLLRGAEVASGRNFTYRDLLAAYSRALLGGPEDSWLEQADQLKEPRTQDVPSHPCGWVEEQVRTVDEDQGGQAQAAAHLVEHRIYTNLFPPFDADGWKRESPGRTQEPTAFGVFDTAVAAADEGATANPFHKSLGYLDPAADIASWDGRRRKVVDLVGALDFQSPSKELELWDAVPTLAASDVERLFDDKLRSELAANAGEESSTSDRRNELLRRHRSVLLLRQVGVALGYMSHHAAVGAWLEEHARALRGEGREGRLARGLRELVFPPSSERRNLFLAPLRPRTRALTELPDEPTVLTAIDPQGLPVDRVATGDSLQVVVSVRRGPEAKPKIVARLVVDLDVAREALLQATEQRGSFTEIGDDAFARIERARASLVGRDSRHHRDLCYTDGAGELYSIERNPTPPPTYRIRELD